MSPKIEIESRPCRLQSGIAFADLATANTITVTVTGTVLSQRIPVG